jgi:hypothetical protein
MQRELVIWVDNAEDVLSDLDRIKVDMEPSEEDINKFKVSFFFKLIAKSDYVILIIYQLDWNSVYHLSSV